MDYSNPKIPEKINYSTENPLKEFAILLIGVFLVIATLVIVAKLLAQNFAQYIPFSYEEKLMPIAFGGEKNEDPSGSNPHQQKQSYLQQLAGKLVVHMRLPEDMHIHANYIDSEIINATATLNGQILINQGLLDYAKSENELAFIMAHEIAHIRERHPIKSLSSGIILGVTVAIISGSINNDGAATALITGTTLTSLSFSRSQEKQADTLALQAIYQHYGHTNGSHNFFTRMQETEKFPDILQFASTHPGMENRIEHLQLLAKKHIHNPSAHKELIAVPSFNEIEKEQDL